MAHLRPHNAPRLVVGCMTGTSLDGLDAALVEIHGRALDITARFLDLASASPFRTCAPGLWNPA